LTLQRHDPDGLGLGRAVSADVMQTLLDGLTLRDREREEISWHCLQVATGRVAAHIERLLAKTFRDPVNRRLAKHLRHEQPWQLSFFTVLNIKATNNGTERALRPAVAARKTWGGTAPKTAPKNPTDSDQHPHHVPSTRQRLL
jgi:hypothetical protein